MVEKPQDVDESSSTIACSVSGVSGEALSADSSQWSQPLSSPFNKWGRPNAPPAFDEGREWSDTLQQCALADAYHDLPKERGAYRDAMAIVPGDGSSGCDDGEQIADSISSSQTDC